MKNNWKRKVERGAGTLFERTLFGVFRGFDRLYGTARTRRVWGDLAEGNSIHPSAICNRVANLTVKDGLTLSANCRLLIGEEGRIAVERVHLEPGVSLLANGGSIEIGYGTYINVGAFLWTEGARLSVGSHVMIGPHCVLSAANHGTQNLEQLIIEQPITSVGISVGDNVWLGAGVIVCDGVSIGQGTIIAAGAVVTKDVPAHVVAGGVPCRVLRSREVAL